MTEIRYTVPGKAQRWQRRVQTKSGISFMPKEYTDYKRRVADIAHEAMNGLAPLDGPVEMVVSIWWPRPKNKNKVRIANDWYWMESTPDADNGGKCQMDSLNHIAYRDDAQVAILRVYMRVCAGPGNQAADQTQLNQTPRADVVVRTLDATSIIEEL